MGIRRGDFVEVIQGADQGKRGKVLAVFPGARRILVEGARLVYKHLRPSRDNPRGGRVRKESSVPMANVMLVCPHCDKPRRQRVRVQADGSKVRICAKCAKEMAG